MRRNIVTETIVLKNYRIGEIHKGVVMLSPEIGVFHTIAHGAYKGKSRMAGITDPFCRSLSYLYYNPVKNSYSLRDIDGKDYFEGLRNDLGKFYTSSLWAEIILKSFGGGGDYFSLFRLFNSALSELDRASSQLLDYIRIQFLSRYISLTGFRADTDECGICGRQIKSTEDSHFYNRDSVFICGSCADPASLRLSPGGKQYLLHTGKQNFSDSIKIGMGEETTEALKNILMEMIQAIVETPLNTLGQGRDYL